MVNPIEVDPKSVFLSKDVAMKCEREWFWKIVAGALWLTSQHWYFELNCSNGYNFGGGIKLNKKKNLNVSDA